MTKAFDLLGHSVLLDKLLAMDFAGCFQVDCFLPVWSTYDLLNLRHVDNNNINLCTHRSRMSPPTNVSVSQDSNLGPILFNLFCMWMTYLIPWKVWLFADDVCHQILIMLTEMLWWIIHNLAWTNILGWRESIFLVLELWKNKLLDFITGNCWILNHSWASMILHCKLVVRLISLQQELS